jgi:hypothetical protein
MNSVKYRFFCIIKRHQGKWQVQNSNNTLSLNWNSGDILLVMEMRKLHKSVRTSLEDWNWRKVLLLQELRTQNNTVAYPTKKSRRNSVSSVLLQYRNSRHMLLVLKEGHNHKVVTYPKTRQWGKFLLEHDDIVVPPENVSLSFSRSLYETVCPLEQAVHPTIMWTAHRLGFEPRKCVMYLLNINIALN